MLKQHGHFSASKLITATIAFRPIALNPFITLRLFAIGPQEKRLGDRQAERLGGRQIDDEIELGRLFDRDIAQASPRAEFCQHSRRRAETGPGSLVHRTSSAGVQLAPTCFTPTA
jgi:hypothetical protein